MIKNNILDMTTFGSDVKDTLTRVAGQLVFDKYSDDKCEMEEFGFESDVDTVISVNDWWKATQDRVCFPVANNVSSPIYASTGMRYIAGYVMNEKDTTIPVYRNDVKYGLVFDLYASVLAMVLLGEYSMANMYLQAVRQIMKYTEAEQRIEEVNQTVIDELDCYIL